MFSTHRDVESVGGFDESDAIGQNISEMRSETTHILICTQKIFITGISTTGFIITLRRIQVEPRSYNVIQL